MSFLKENETLDDLQLKNLCVIQKKHGFRFGVDAVLLANFAKINKAARVIDLCSGTGIIPFIVAGKSLAEHITGIEIQKDMVDMAKRSVKYNKLETRVDFINEDLKNLDFIKSLPKAHVVTVNPPYKLQNSGILNAVHSDAISRHEVCCTLEDVIIACKILLRDNGRMYMVHRPERLADIICTMRKHKIEPKLIRMVHPNYNKVPNIVLIEAQRDAGAFLKWEAPLYIYDEKGNYSDELQAIYGRDI